MVLAQLRECNCKHRPNSTDAGPSHLDGRIMLQLGSTSVTTSLAIHRLFQSDTTLPTTTTSKRITPPNPTSPHPSFSAPLLQQTQATRPLCCTSCCMQLPRGGPLNSCFALLLVSHPPAVAAPQKGTGLAPVAFRLEVASR